MEVKKWISIKTKIKNNTQRVIAVPLAINVKATALKKPTIKVRTAAGSPILGNCFAFGAVFLKQLQRLIILYLECIVESLGNLLFTYIL